MQSGTSTTILVAASSVQFGDGTVRYVAGSVNPGTLGAWFIYADDPGYAGGVVTYHATANESDVYARSGRLYFGKITTVGEGEAVGEELPLPFPLPFPLADFLIKFANLGKSSVTSATKTGVTEALMRLSASLDDLEKTVIEQQFVQRVRRGQAISALENELSKLEQKVAAYLRSHPGRIEAGQLAMSETQTFQQPSITRKDAIEKKIRQNPRGCVTNEEAAIYLGVVPKTIRSWKTGQVQSRHLKEGAKRGTVSNESILLLNKTLQSSLKD